MKMIMMMIKVLSKDSQGGCLACDPGYVYTLTFDNRYKIYNISNNNSTNGVLSQQTETWVKLDFCLPEVEF